MQEPAGQLSGTGYDAHWAAEWVISMLGSTSLRKADTPVLLRQPLHGGENHLGHGVSDQPASVDQYARAVYGRHGAGISGHVLLHRGHRKNHLVDSAVPDLRSEFTCGLGF